MGTVNEYRKALAWGADIAAKKFDFRIESPNEFSKCGHAIIDILGKPSVFIWNEIGLEECRISVWFNCDAVEHPKLIEPLRWDSPCLGNLPNVKRREFSRYVGLCASGWLQRHRGLYIQGVGSHMITDQYARREDRELLKFAPSPTDLDFQIEEPGVLV